MFGLVKFMIKDDIKFNQLFQRILSVFYLYVFNEPDQFVQYPQMPESAH